MSQKNTDEINLHLPDNNQFIYLIGSNGSGKSRALEKHAAKNCFRRPVVVISSACDDKFTYRPTERHFENGSYRYLGNRTVGNGTHKGTLAANVALLYVEVIKKNLHAEMLHFLELIGFSPKISITLRKTKKSVDFSFKETPLDLFFIETQKFVLLDKNKPFEAVFYKKETDVHGFRFSDLSSGEQYIISTGLKILASISDDTCFYIDEPELSLHVEWQIKWPEYFQTLIQKKRNTAAYIATHSPIIIASAMKCSTESICYQIENGELKRIAHNSGWSVEDIIFDDFNTCTPNNKSIYSHLAQFLNNAANMINGRLEITEETERQFDVLTSNIRNTSSVAQDKDFIERLLGDFEMAKNELFKMAKN